ncbi:segregation/condensation protein A [Actinoplanes sp. NPDC051346]|uniref:segregation/condensation protein A n=1 Tax=Actinoplanes sp. NPDC051346 TaxID=3155048 RepID=UPI00343A5646
MDASAAAAGEADTGKFTVRLTNFTGPFDLLLQLIGKHKLDVTEVALHQVTDDFIAYIRAMGDDWDLGEASEFLLIAATLLDLKAARLLPAAEVEDEEDLALLEARDLLFSRLLQYKAFKEAAAHLAELESTGARRWPRAVSLELRYSEALPELVLGIGPERMFKLALKQFTPKPGPPEVSIAHIHQVRVSVREHANLIRDRLRRAGLSTFSLLVADCENTLEVVARFLALLELYREGLVDFEQPVSLDELTIRWIGGSDAEGELDIDDYEGTPPEPDTAATEPDTDARVAVDDGDASAAVDDGDAWAVAGDGDSPVAADDGDAWAVAGDGDSPVAADDGDAWAVAGDGDASAAVDDGDAWAVAGDGDSPVAADDGDARVAAGDGDFLDEDGDQDGPGAEAGPEAPSEEDKQ